MGTTRRTLRADAGRSTSAALRRLGLAASAIGLLCLPAFAPTALAGPDGADAGPGGSGDELGDDFWDSFENPPDAQYHVRAVQRERNRVLPAPALVRSTLYYNKGPRVAIGPTQTLASGSTSLIDGDVSESDYMGWTPGYLDWTWWSVGGHPVAAFADPHALPAQFTVAAPGQYWLGLEGDDGLSKVHAYRAVNVVPAEDVARFRRVMLAGDSITQGHGGVDRFGYRPALWRALVDRQCLVDLVGDSTANSSHQYGSGFDPHHVALGGATSAQVANAIVGQLDIHRPDILVIHVGTNDLNGGGRQPSAVVETLRGLVEDVRERHPNVTFLIAQLIDGKVGMSNNLPQYIDELNALLPGLADLTTSTSPVVIVDHHTGFDTGLHTSDGLHPNAAGEQLMADRWTGPLTDALGAACGT